METDNLYQMTVAGSYLWLHQRSRGTQQILLTNSTYRLVQANVANEDGGNFTGADVVYINGTGPRPTSGQRATDGWAPVAVSAGLHQRALRDRCHRTIVIEHT